MAHSLGAMAAMMAMRKGLAMERWCFWRRRRTRIGIHASSRTNYRLPREVAETMKTCYVARHGLAWSDLFVAKHLGEPCDGVRSGRDRLLIDSFKEPGNSYSGDSRRRRVRRVFPGRSTRSRTGT